MRKVYTGQEIEQIIQKDRPYISVDYSTYINTKTKCRFIDSEYGEWWSKPLPIITRGGKHPARAAAQRSKAYSTPIEDISKRLLSHISIVPETYISGNKKADFIDSEYGRWTATVSNVLRGRGHPKRGHESTAKRNMISLEEVKARLPSHVTLDESTYVDTSTKARFIDSEYGEWWDAPKDVFRRAGHPERRAIEAKKARALRPKRQGNKLTVQQVQLRILSINPYVVLDVSTYVDTKTKCRFVDSEYGEFYAHPQDIMMGHQCRARGLSFRAQPNKLSADEVERRIQDTRPYISLDKTTYVDTHTKARFIDSEYGEWWARPYCVYDQGDDNPKRFSRGFSKGEKELAEFIRQYAEINENKRFYYDKQRFFEADIYIPSKNLAIEYNGVYWHSSDHKSSDYHLKKREYFESQGIQLLQFYETEWASKRSIIESIIQAKLGVSAKKYQARKLEIKDVDNKEAQDFLQGNHLMGKYVPAKYVGLYDGSDLVSLLGWRKVKDGVDISRFCNKAGCSVAGAYSRLLKFIQNSVFPAFIQSFVDLRYGNGKTLEGMGFTLAGVTLGWMWCDGVRMYNRLSCRANMDDRGLSEAEHAAELGWFKVYDSGQAKYVYNRAE
jgi:hypothetical protein